MNRFSNHSRVVSVPQAACSSIEQYFSKFTCQTCRSKRKSKTFSFPRVLEKAIDLNIWNGEEAFRRSSTFVCQLLIGKSQSVHMSSISQRMHTRFTCNRSYSLVILARSSFLCLCDAQCSSASTYRLSVPPMSAEGRRKLFWFLMNFHKQNHEDFNTS